MPVPRQPLAAPPGAPPTLDQAPAPPAGPWIDAAILAFILGVFAGLIALGRQWWSPFRPEVEIDLSLASLPYYAFLSLSRGIAAYLLSLAFTLAYGSVAGHSRRAERVMIPLLDILQGVPVLSFLPGLVIGLVGLFPGSNLGLELACVLAIFTGQVWNMTFSYYGSIRAIPAELREVARLHRFGWWKRFTALEAPAAAIGLVWNSMMSMAGGWFFLTVVESFTLEGHSYRLPGIGSYMRVAVEERDVRAMLGACGAMVVVIVLVDQLLWRPLIVWAQRFKVEETASAEKPTSWVYDLVLRSRMVRRVSAGLRERLRSDGAPPAAAASGETVGLREPTERAARLAAAAGWVVALGLGGLALLGAWHLVTLLSVLRWRDWLGLLEALGFTTLRVLAVMAISALWTVPAGVAIGRSPRASRIAQPLIQLVASFPAPMVYPLLAPLVAAVGGFGIGCTLLMVLGSQWYVLFNVVAGAMAVPSDLREVASVYGLRGFARFRILYLAGIFPYLITGLITAAGGAWNASIIAEWVPLGHGRVLVAHGIGSLISQAFDRSDDALLAAGVLVLSTALVAANRLVWKPLSRLADTRYALNR
jgi:NitT/TauT family transport system permease protein